MAGLKQGACGQSQTPCSPDLFTRTRCTDCMGPCSWFGFTTLVCVVTGAHAFRRILPCASMTRRSLWLWGSALPLAHHADWSTGSGTHGQKECFANLGISAPLLSALCSGAIISYHKFISSATPKMKGGIQHDKHEAGHDCLT